QPAPAGAAGRAPAVLGGRRLGGGGLPRRSPGRPRAGWRRGRGPLVLDEGGPPLVDPAVELVGLAPSPPARGPAGGAHARAALGQLDQLGETGGRRALRRARRVVVHRVARRGPLVGHPPSW